MSNGFRVDPDAHHRAVPRLSDAAEQLEAALADLRSVLAGCAGMCGGDHHGRSFAEEYADRARLIDDALRVGGHRVTGVANAVQTMADNYLAVDEAHAARLGGGQR